MSDIVAPPTAAWHTVLERVVDPHPFQSPWWQRAWWEHRGSGRLIVSELDGPAAAALAVDDDGTVRFVGDTETTDYPGPVIAPGGADACAASLLDLLTTLSPRPRRLDARDLRDGDGFPDALVRAAAAAGLACELTDDEPVAVLSLPDSAAAWRDALSAHSRRELARKRRRLQREVPRAAVRTADAGSLQSDLDAFCALHRAASGLKGGYLTPSIEALWREVADLGTRDGTLRLDTLEDAEGRALAMTFAFQGPQALYLYNMAFDAAVASLSPGIVLAAAIVERAIEAGLQRVDFLRGLERYKLELGATPQTLRRVRVAL